MFEIGDVIFYIDEDKCKFAQSEIINIHEIDEAIYIVLKSGKVLAPNKCFTDIDAIVNTLTNNIITEHPKTAKGSFVDDEGTLTVMWQWTSQQDTKPGLVYVPNESLEKLYSR